MNKNKNLITVTARSLIAGDVCAGSGFTVSHNAWAGVRTPKGRVNVEGAYPGAPVTVHHWNASTRVQVLR